MEPNDREKCLLAGMRPQGVSHGDPGDPYVELALLADTSGAQVSAVITQPERKPEPKFFVGSGKVSEITAAAREHGAELVIFNHELSPLQFRNLERELEVKVIDRTQLILDIFAMRARSNEGKIQVELAQLEYLLPRITGRGVELSRLGGGIGTRGPGETKLEVDRRRIRRRISVLKKKLEKVERNREIQKGRRKKSGVPVITLVGYTNAGKTTLFNALSYEDSLAEDKLFATLDPLTRRVYLPGAGRVLLIDTVGFIRDLPVELVESFKSTLEVVRDAHLMLHVVDVSAEQCEEQMEEVKRTVESLGAGDIPELTVFNKIDAQVPGERLERLMKGHPGAVAVSALKREGFDELRESMAGFTGSGSEKKSG